MSGLEKAWYKGATWLYLLVPLSLLYRLLIRLRRSWQQGIGSSGDRNVQPTAQGGTAAGRRVPVVIIGNITVGGTGKTPLLMALIEHLKAQGHRPGVISRGYGAASDHFPLLVEAGMDPALTGDEPLLIASRCGCPVVIDPRRPRALAQLLADHDVSVVLSDDGLQHYRLRRDLEFVVVDGSRLFGNGLCLPAGPLREPVARLREADCLIVNGEPDARPPSLAAAHVMQIRPTSLRNLVDERRQPFHGAPFRMGETVQAVAAIGNPQRFFELLQELPYELSCFAFPDHSPLDREQLADAGVDFGKAIVMTEKDGIKCQPIAGPDWWVLEYTVELPPAFYEQLDRLLEGVS